ncbi:MAG: tRNA (5-methylaminomethyl-2-thiouridylate)-methyltransferase [candidate division Zixibacteria bacterium]|nr:tRNA (5-methylaminomethyl-2-thiouridylate)-methyltransferase [candidate division Zixibacteria bacterium]
MKTPDVPILADPVRGHAIALFSGGLDSALAILLVMQQNIRVTALTFFTHFNSEIRDRATGGEHPYPTAEKFGFTVRLVHLGEPFLDIVRSPKHGHGRNMNPCIDCRIAMLTEAKRYMELVGADFVITGEVLSQRPMSQFRSILNVVERDSGLKGHLVRPLSAQLLRETIPEQNGLLDRTRLGRIAGRSRRPQMELAEQFGLEDFSPPAGGCLLTDVGYSRRLRDFIEHSDTMDFHDVNLLRLGRHFRLDEHTKLIVGRREKDNHGILRNARPGHIILEAQDTGSPIALYISSAGEKHLLEAAAITARYCDARNEKLVMVKCLNENDGRTWTVAPADPEQIKAYIIK